MSKLIKSFEGFTIWSGDYLNLAKWYQETFELKKINEINLPNDKAIAFEITAGSEMMLWIGSHSEVSGKSKDPYRQMISYWVEDVYTLSNILKNKNVEIINGPDKSPDGELNFLTARDPELNLIQMFSK